jgi:hypothetical protein
MVQIVDEEWRRAHPVFGGVLCLCRKCDTLLDQATGEPTRQVATPVSEVEPCVEAQDCFPITTKPGWCGNCGGKWQSVPPVACEADPRADELLERLSKEHGPKAQSRKMAAPSVDIQELKRQVVAAIRAERLEDPNEEDDGDEAYALALRHAERAVRDVFGGISADELALPEGWTRVLDGDFRFCCTYPVNGDRCDRPAGFESRLHSESGDLAGRCDDHDPRTFPLQTEKKV